MIDEQSQSKVSELSAWRQHRFFILVIGVIVVALMLVVVAMEIYNNSGTAQLDLSRPGYTAVRKEVAKVDNVQYHSTGPIDASALDEFKRLYEERTSKATALQSFEPEAMSEDSLQLFDSTSATSTQ